MWWLWAACFEEPPRPLQGRPNVVLILADDQGYADLGVYGSGQAPAGEPWQPWDRVSIPTPRLDRLAHEGILFTDFASAYPTCTAARGALLTGSLPSRIDLDGRALYPDSETGLNPDEITIAELLRARGYATALFGKWHLGHQAPFLPTQQGFDRFAGIPYSHNMWMDPELPLAPDVVLREGWTRGALEALRGLDSDALTEATSGQIPWIEQEAVTEFPVDPAVLTRRITDDAIAFVDAHVAEPFFLYVAHPMPHVPLGASPDFLGTTRRDLYGDVIAELDHEVGRLVDALDARGLGELTWVIYASDNGPWLLLDDEGGSAFPFRGGKTTWWEGGVRVPTLMRWTGTLPAQERRTFPGSFVDVLPTVAEVTGAALPDDRPLDGVSLWAPILGAPAAERPLFYDTFAVRQGRWKWIDGQLYDLATDAGEATDVAAHYPDVATTLDALLQRHRADIEAERRPRGSLSAR